MLSSSILAVADLNRDREAQANAACFSTVAQTDSQFAVANGLAVVPTSARLMEDGRFQELSLPPLQMKASPPVC